MQRVKFKRGDSLYLAASWQVVQLGDGATRTWTGTSVVSTSNGGQLVDTLNVSLGAAGTNGVAPVLLSSSSTTINYPLEILICDIKWTSSDGKIVHSDPFEIEMQQPITQ